MERRGEYGNRNQELLAHIYKILAFRGEVAAGVTKGTREFKDSTGWDIRLLSTRSGWGEKEVRVPAIKDWETKEDLARGWGEMK